MSDLTAQATSSGSYKEGSQTGVNRFTGILSILTVIGFILPFTILLVGLRFTDQPANIAFPIFRQQSATVLLSFYALSWDGLLLIAMVLMFYRVMGNRSAFSLIVATVFGVIGGLMQTIGDLRWPFLLPYLANTYFDPGSSQASRAAVVVVFQTVDQFAGIELSEHLYYLFIGVWTLLIGLYLLRSLRSGNWIAWLGIISGCGLLISSIEQFDWPPIEIFLLIVVVASRLLWSIWLLIIATMLFRSHRQTGIMGVWGRV